MYMVLIPLWPVECHQGLAQLSDGVYDPFSKLPKVQNTKAEITDEFKKLQNYKMAQLSEGVPLPRPHFLNCQNQPT